MGIKSDIRDRLAEQVINKSGINDSAKSSLRTVKDKFGISVYQYPSDLGSEDLQHYIEFGINVRGKSELDKDKRLFEVQRNPDAANMSSEDIAGVAATGGGIVGGVVTATITNSILKYVDKTGAKSASSSAATTALGSKSAANKAITGAAGLAGYGLTRAAISANQMLKPDTTYRISDVIALYVDGPPTVKYSMNYANKDLGTLAGIIKGGLIESLGALNPLGEKGAAALVSLGKLPGAFGSVDLQSAFSASAKTSLNPFREVIFESVDFRSFSFKYKFLPKSPEESRAVKEIIRLFKYHMHPEMSKDKLFFIYPSEFQITYYYGNSENGYFHKFSPCALESMDVTYGGEQFSSFADGNPTEVNMTLTFRELEILTKNMINQGY